MRILITGAAGGIGSTLSDFFYQNGYDLILVDNLRNGYIKNLNENSIKDFLEIDIRDLSTIKTFNKIDAIIHLAAITSLADCETNSQETISVNVQGTVSVLEFARRNSIPHVIFASTGAVYENNKEEVFVENLEVKPRLLYSLSKKMAEDVCESYRINYGMNITTLRFFNVFGPKQDAHRKSAPLLNYLVKQFYNNSIPILHSDGNQVRDYVYVQDVIRLIQLCLVYKPNDTFNVCSNTLLSVKNIVNFVKNEFNSDIEPLYREADMLWDSYPELFKGDYPLKKEIVRNETKKYSRGSYEKAKLILNWIPQTNWSELFSKTVKEIKNNL